MLTVAISVVSAREYYVSLGGDDRFYNNLFVNHSSLVQYDEAAQPVQMAGNVFIDGANPSRHEENPIEVLQ